MGETQAAGPMVRNEPGWPLVKKGDANPTAGDAGE